jgi:hypothetical protein
VKPFLPNRLPEVTRRNYIAGLELYSGQSLVQAHINRFYIRKPLNIHDHGVDTDHSVHTEDRHIDLEELGFYLRRNKEQDRVCNKAIVFH